MLARVKIGTPRRHPELSAQRGFESLSPHRGCRARVDERPFGMRKDLGATPSAALSKFKYR